MIRAIALRQFVNTLTYRSILFTNRRYVIPECFYRESSGVIFMALAITSIMMANSIKVRLLDSRLRGNDVSAVCGWFSLQQDINKLSKRDCPDWTRLKIALNVSVR